MNKMKYLLLLIMVCMVLASCSKNEVIKAPVDEKMVSEGEKTASDDEKAVAEGEKTASDDEKAVAADMAPDFTVDMSDGSRITLSDMKGKAVLINFWATWCAPCCRELPAFQQLYDEYGDRLQLMVVNYGESRKTVDKFIEKNGYTFPFAYDEDGAVSMLYPSDGIPYTLVIDSEGVIRKTFLGAGSADVQYEKYKAVIDEVLNE